MAQARPIVASRIGALSCIIEDNKNGLLFESGNKQDLAEKIQYLWNKQNLCQKLGQAARKKVRNEYSPKKCYEALINVYNKAEKYKI
jgi:glycosyltransferase involved in cell wall biosynthesis